MQQTSHLIPEFTAVQRSRRSVRRQRARRWRKAGLAYLFLLPFLILFVVFFLITLGYALWISVFADRLVGGTVFIGMQNYLRVLQDGAFWEGVRRIGLFMLVQVPVMLLLALLFALLLDSGRVKFPTLFRLGFFLPYAIPSVVSALLWGYLYSPNIGPFAQLATLLHLPAPGFLTEAGMLPSLGNIVTWQWTGYNMIIMYSALKAIAPELYEAALLDGARPWQIARFVKIPLIVPAIILTCIFSIIGSLQLFNEPSIMSTLAPTIIGDHYTPNLYAYTLAFTNQQYNYSAAVSFTLGAIVCGCSYLFLLITNRRRLR